MPEFIFRANARLSGVTVYIDADNIEEAKEKAKSHDYDDYDYESAECYDLEIDISSGEPNE